MITAVAKERTQAAKVNPAIAPDGERTIWGYLHPGDIPILARRYPLIGESVIQQIAEAINHPRLLEVSGIVEVVHRYLEGTFSRIRGATFNVVSNPLSILYWNKDAGRVQRIKTRETEMLHGPSEKLALRTGGLRQVNEILGATFGLQLAFGCSCCTLVIATQDLAALLASDYYAKRESFGRQFDSDVLCTTGDLFSDVSVADVPSEVLEASADFHAEEVHSYLRFASVNEEVIRQNRVVPVVEADEDLIRFLLG